MPTVSCSPYRIRAVNNRFYESHRRRSRGSHGRSPYTSLRVVKVYSELSFLIVHYSRILSAFWSLSRCSDYDYNSAKQYAYTTAFNLNISSYMRISFRSNNRLLLFVAFFHRALPFLIDIQRTSIKNRSLPLNLPLWKAWIFLIMTFAL